VAEELLDLRALRDEREAARERIGAAYAEGLFDADELDRRLEELEAATSFADVRRLVADIGGAIAVPQPTALARPNEASAHDAIKVIFSETARRGAWRPARSNDVKSFFASAVIDLREATLAAGETLFELDVIFGEVEIIAPPGMPIVQELSAWFASIEEDEEVGDHAPTDGRIRISGRVIFGSVSVMRRLPGETKREAKRRRKQERKRLEGTRRRALPGS
jgi:hypothetical protein